VKIKIKQVELFRYCLPFEKTLKLKGQPVIERQGLLLRLSSDDDHTGWGEIAPLPGFSSEDLDTVIAETGQLESFLTDRTVPPDIARLDGRIARFLDDCALSHSTVFGIEQALLSLAASSQQVSLPRLLNSRAKLSVPLNALVTGDATDAVEQARLNFQQGYRAIKLKVGRLSVQEDAERALAVRGAISDTAALRLDANCAWTMPQAVEFAERIGDCNIEYIEEPLTDNRLLPEFCNKTGLPVALDESLTGIDIQTIEPFDGLIALILKPTLLGGLDKTASYVKRTDSLSLMPVISSSFESSVGIYSLAAFAAAFITEEIPCGLDTFTFFMDDLLREPIQQREGCILLEDFQPMIDLPKLSRLNGK
jgi:O-succinylbenzoate synthase